jgi:hypothetical protein
VELKTNVSETGCASIIKVDPDDADKGFELNIDTADSIHSL